MFDSMKNDKGKIITLIGMAVMLIAVAVKAATSSMIAAAAIHAAGLACFFIIEGIEKTPDSESGLSVNLSRLKTRASKAALSGRLNNGGYA